MLMSFSSATSRRCAPRRARTPCSGPSVPATPNPAVGQIRRGRWRRCRLLGVPRLIAGLSGWRRGVAIVGGMATLDPSRGVPGQDAPELSFVAHAHNEEDNVRELVRQVGAAGAAMGLAFECVIVDDGSTDATRARIVALIKEHPWLRCVAMIGTPPGRGSGQSAAFHAGFRAARGRVIAVLDADLQNDPGEVPAMLAAMRHRRPGWSGRSVADASGQPGAAKWARGSACSPGSAGRHGRDPGCSLRLMKRESRWRCRAGVRGHAPVHRSPPAPGYRVEGWK